MKAEAAAAADASHKGRDPRATTHGEPNMKSSVVAALTVESTAPYHVSKLTPSHGHTAQDAKRKACHPGNPSGSRTLSLTTGRNQAAAWSSHAPEIKR